MKAPSQLDSLSMAGDEVGTGGTYPPLGFRPVWDAELGNGDYFGLYWPYGCEEKEPIVCDMLHDEWGLQVAFSSVAIFIEWLELNDGYRGDVVANDPGFVGRRYQEAKSLLGNQPEQAISKLQQLCEDFPESAEYWFTLAGQLRRTGDTCGCHAAAVRAYTSNWAFGMPPDGILRLLKNAKGHIDDPLVARSEELSTIYGGTKENSNYIVLKDCIDEYLSSATPVFGLRLNQNYGYMMSMETTSFQERNAFDPQEWLDEHIRLCEEYVGDSRTRVS